MDHLDNRGDRTALLVPPLLSYALWKKRYTATCPFSPWKNPSLGISNECEMMMMMVIAEGFRCSVGEDTLLCVSGLDWKTVEKEKFSQSWDALMWPRCVCIWETELHCFHVSPLQPLYNQPSDTKQYHENIKMWVYFSVSLVVSFKTINNSVYWALKNYNHAYL